jgi:hypothetical protein
MSKESAGSDHRLRNKLKSVFELTQQNPIPWKKINKQMQGLLEEFKTSDLAKVLFLNINDKFYETSTKETMSFNFFI